MKNLNEQKMHSNIKRGIKMKVTPEQNEIIQNIIYPKGINWGDTIATEKIKRCPYMILNEDKNGARDENGLIKINLRIGYSHSDYLDSTNVEVSPEFFIKTRGTCEEVYYDYNV
jgi:hypothetical protein